MEQVESQLEILTSRIQSGEVGRSREWRGAKVVIAQTAPEPLGAGFYPEPRLVITQIAPQLSWLFYRLRDVFSPHYDYVSKFEFFGRLANAALRYQRLREGRDDAMMLSAVLREAFAIAEEMEEGSFGYLDIAFGGEIFDDHRAGANRRGFSSIDEAHRFFIDKGFQI